jgi:hypothetical protein
MNGSRCRAGFLQGLGRHQGYRRPYLAEGAAYRREDRLILAVPSETVLTRYISRGQDSDHPRQPGSHSHIQFQQAGMSVRAAKNTYVQHAGQIQVFYIPGLSGNLLN